MNYIPLRGFKSSAHLVFFVCCCIATSFTISWFPAVRRHARSISSYSRLTLLQQGKKVSDLKYFKIILSNVLRVAREWDGMGWGGVGMGEFYKNQVIIEIIERGNNDKGLKRNNYSNRVKVLILNWLCGFIWMLTMRKVQLFH